jgi:hypothetical protein
LPAALVGFVIVEFAGSALSEWAVYAAGLLYLGAFLALAAMVARAPERLWAAASVSSQTSSEAFA